MKVQILMGLSGSGKTTYAMNLARFDSSVVRINLDALQSSRGVIETLNSFNSFYGSSKTHTYVIDGLIHTNNQLIDVLKELLHNKELNKVEVHYWKENKEQCLTNNLYRRKVSNYTSIEDLTLDIPSEEELKSIFLNTVVIHHEVPQKPDWLIFSDKHGLSCTLNNPYFRSDGWSTGGTCGGCSLDEPQPIEEEDAPDSFDEFDDLIESIDNEISPNVHEELSKECVSIESYGSRDYYGVMLLMIFISVM